ncbi:MAG: FAD-dependent oxidoreductase, partial [Gammaproteobacteria bacterium]
MGNDDDSLGMQARISRRDFLGGVAMATTALALPAAQAGSNAAPPPVGDGAAYPPLRSGLRGQYPGSFEIAHQLRDGAFGASLAAEDTGEHHDLVVVGAGISGLAAAHFFRRALGAGQRVLLLDNHDDFGGHAKRNEFRHEGRSYLSFGGTMSIETPFPYSYTSKALLAELGVDAGSFARYERPERVKGLGTGVFFDEANFRADRLVAGFGERSWETFFADAPLTPRMREDLLRVYTAREDRLPGLDPRAKANALKQMSYAAWLRQHVGIAEESLAFFRGMGFRNNMRVDTCPAFVAWRSGAAGFGGMEIAAEPLAHSEQFHFPDGNATLARLLVNRLVPACFSRQHDPESIVLAALDYAML